MRVLIVEDDTDARELLKVLLEQDGHEVTCVSNGREGLDAFGNMTFSVIISDWQMQEIDGIELCRMVRAADTPNYIYIILLTALRGKARYLEAMNAGADDFVTKPYDPEELRARLMVADRIVRLQEHVKKLEAKSGPAGKKAAYENILWALLNTKEFVFNQ